MVAGDTSLGAVRDQEKDCTQCLRPMHYPLSPVHASDVDERSKNSRKVLKKACAQLVSVKTK
jgi:hypothetical protein